ncbi:Uncharacterized protein dnl_41950 [Desulfonema limicola]|uniref:Uncharacterized protein n=1 Tax=Desulfonema limicola TaxID=45656 RepID=A0A975BA51_9BACT|nr:hypothetical protein [Desulfonema limicola]QTA81844.1 Uncharacterized protein dnl_41950 [Desulfonema limicola]
MKKNLDTKTFEQLMAEADELIQQLNSDVIKEMEEEHRIQFEHHTQRLEKIKSEVQSGMGNKETTEINHGANGMNEAIQDIVKAMQNLKNKIF